jgi:cation:H+ antiporter
MFWQLLAAVLAFVAIWIGSGLAIKSVEKLSASLRISSFSVSFVLLGLFTSLSELSVGLNAVMKADPEIFVGNLIGASIILFMLIIPLLAVLGKPIRIRPELQGFRLPASLFVIALPVFLVIDGRLGQIDAWAAIILFILLVLSIQQKQQSVLEKIRGFGKKARLRVGKEIIRILFGVVIIFVASRMIVEQTIFFAELMEVSPFLLSLLFIAFGTNLPELSLVIRSIFMKNNQVAFGDYIGSAAFNTFLLGGLTLLYGEKITLNHNYLYSLLFLLGGLSLFYYFARSKNTLSRLEGLVLLAWYGLFLYFELQGITW